MNNFESKSAFLCKHALPLRPFEKKPIQGIYLENPKNGKEHFLSLLYKAIPLPPGEIANFKSVIFIKQ